MHSSRMRTGRSLIVCCSLLPEGGGGLVPGVLPGRGGWSQGGSPWQGGFSLAGGFSLGCPWPGGGSPWQGGLPGGGFFLADPPPVNRMTDRCKNITLATTSLRPVINSLDDTF